MPFVPAGGDPRGAGGAGPARPAPGAVRLRARACRPSPGRRPGGGPFRGAPAASPVRLPGRFQHVLVERCRLLIADVTGAATSEATSTPPQTRPQHHGRPAPAHARHALATARIPALPVSITSSQRYPSPHVNGLNAYPADQANLHNEQSSQTLARRTTGQSQAGRATGSHLAVIVAR